MTRVAPNIQAYWQGRELGRYACIDVLGEGGAGIVVRARDRLCGREVAIKLPRLLPPPAAARRWIVRARLLREAEALRVARHPNVVGLHEVVVADGLVYLVMPVLDAAPLDRRRVTWRAGLAVGLQIGAALASVHAAGLVHRDVAPRNVLVAASGRAWLIDFGLARALGPSAADEDSFAALALTGSGPGPGTRRFVAPEQRRGEVVDGRADQYGLCATLWRCITGAAPGEGPGVDDLATALPERLARVLRRGLAERPEQRHGDMRALVAALAGCGPT